MRPTKISFFLFLFSLSSISNIALAQTADKLYFSGNFSNHNFRPESINVSYRFDDGFDIAKATRIKADADNSGNFSFTTPNMGKVYQIFINAKLNNSNSGKFLDETFYTEPGDNINVEINTGNQNKIKAEMFKFSGKGSEKYNLVSKLKILQEQYDLEPFRRKLHPDSIKGGWTQLNSILDSIASLARKYERKKENLIANTSVNNTIKKIIEFEYARFKNEWFIWTSFYYRAFPDYQSKIKEKYAQYRNEFLVEPDNSLSIYSSKYFIYESSRIGFELELLNDSKLAKMESFYNAIKSNFQGKIQQKMIGYMFRLNVEEKFFKTASNFVKDSLITDALKTVFDPYIRIVLEEEANRYSLLTKKIINAEFINLDGTTFNLKSLNGKVILIESWFLGCGPCAILHGMFEKDVYPKFKNNKNFVVLSINIDKQDKSWREGIKSGKYTSDHYINVRNSQEFEHPFFKHYGINSNPMMMLIDSDGFIRYKPKSTSAKMLIDQIELAFKESDKITMESSL